MLFSCMILHDIRLSLELSCTTCRCALTLSSSAVKSQLKLDCCGNYVCQPHTDLSMSIVLPHTHLTTMDPHCHNCQCVCVHAWSDKIILILIASSQWLIESLYGSGFGAYYMAAWSDIRIIFFIIYWTLTHNTNIWRTHGWQLVW